VRNPLQFNEDVERIITNKFIDQSLLNLNIVFEEAEDFLHHFQNQICAKLRKKLAKKQKPGNFRKGNLKQPARFDDPDAWKGLSDAEEEDEASDLINTNNNTGNTTGNSESLSINSTEGILSNLNLLNEFEEELEGLNLNSFEEEDGSDEYEEDDDEELRDLIEEYNSYLIVVETIEFLCERILNLTVTVEPSRCRIFLPLTAPTKGNFDPSVIVDSLFSRHCGASSSSSNSSLTKFWKVPAPLDESSRHYLLQKMLSLRSKVLDFSLHRLVAETAGFSAADLELLVQLAKLHKIEKGGTCSGNSSSDISITVTEADLLKVRFTLEPAACRQTDTFLPRSKLSADYDVSMSTVGISDDQIHSDGDSNIESLSHLFETKLNLNAEKILLNNKGHNNSLISSKANSFFSFLNHQITGLPELKRELTQHFFFNNESNINVLSPHLSLHGPSGSGKTLLAFSIAQALKRNTFLLQVADILRPKLGESEKRLDSVLIQSAFRGAPSCVIIEGAEQLLGKDGDKSRDDDTSSKFGTTERLRLLLRQGMDKSRYMARNSDSEEEPVLVILTYNDHGSESNLSSANVFGSKSIEENSDDDLYCNHRISKRFNLRYLNEEEAIFLLTQRLEKHFGNVKTVTQCIDSVNLPNLEKLKEECVAKLRQDHGLKESFFSSEKKYSAADVILLAQEVAMNHLKREVALRDQAVI